MTGGERGVVAPWVVDASDDPRDPRAAEQERRELTDHLQLALDAAELGTWRWNLASGEVVWDERMEALFGFAPGAFDGTFDAYRAALHPEDREHVLATVQHAIENKGRYRIEHRISGPDGTIRWIHGAGQVTLDETGTVTGAIGCSMDASDRITARLAAEAAAGVALRTAERERVDRERLEFLTALNDALADATTQHDIMWAVTRASVPRLGDWCSVFVLPDDGGRVPLVETYHADPDLVEVARALTEQHPYDPDAPTGMAAVIRTGQAEFHPDLDAEHLDDLLDDAGYHGDAADDLRRTIERLALRSTVSVPLVKHGRILGGLAFTNTAARRTFTPVDLDLAHVVAGRVASSLENRRLAEAQRRIAATLQASLLPAVLPAVPGLDVAVRYWAAGEGTTVGGDFYDVFHVDGDRWAIVIGDVCGTGPEAAAVTSMARHTIRQAAWRGDEPAELLGWLNRAMRELDGRPTFLTVALVTIVVPPDPPDPPDPLDPLEALDASITCAGHPPAVLVRADGDASALGAPGRLIGVFDEVRTTTVPFELAPRDTLVLYTDGLTDVPPPHTLDTRQTVELIADAVSGASTADEIASAIEAGVQRRLLVQHRPDDIAVVVLRRTSRLGRRSMG